MRLEGLKIEHTTTVDRVVTALRRTMFDGKITPGEKLREMVLSETFSVSRSTIREALRTLVTSGLAVHLPNKGVIVRKLTVAEINDIFLTRSVLETAAVRASLTCSAEALERLRKAMGNFAAAVRTGDSLVSADAHIEFHSTLVELIGSRRLMETERAIMQDLQLVIASIDSDRDDLDREVEKHRRLTQLLLDRNESAAIQWIVDDLAIAKEFALQQIAVSR